MAKQPDKESKLAAVPVERYGDESLDYLTISPRAKELRNPPPNPRRGEKQKKSLAKSATS